MRYKIYSTGGIGEPFPSVLFEPNPAIRIEKYFRMHSEKLPLLPAAPLLASGRRDVAESSEGRLRPRF